MATSKPLRGTSREIADHQLAVGGQPEVTACLAPLVVVERVEAIGVDAGRHDGDRQRAAGGPLGLLPGVLPCRDDVAGPTQHDAERLLRPRQAAGNGDLGAVQHDVVGQGERRSDEPERNGRVEHDEVGTEVGGQLVDAAHHQRVRQQHLLGHALDAVRLLGVECRGPAVRAGEHGERLRWQPPPPLPQQRLDPADLRREVVRDEQVFHSLFGPSAIGSGFVASDRIGLCNAVATR